MELSEIIEETIANGTRHKWYKRTVDLASKYNAFILNQEDEKGEQPLNKYLHQFVRREDDDLFEQRKNLTKHYLPSICTQIIRPFTKVVRSNRVAKVLEHESSEVTMDLEDAMRSFYGDSDNDGLEQFLSVRFLPLTFTDPNTWVCITFDSFDGNTEKPKPYPVEYSSEKVINWKIQNDQTKWVIVKLSYDYQNKEDQTKSADRYLIYGDNVALEYKQIPEDIKEAFLNSDTSLWINPKNDKQKFAVYTYNHNSERVPLMRVGYILDPFTKSQTCVNPFHYEALPIMEQFLKVSSELQLGITLHVFPKQVSYVPQCEAKGCANGLMADGTDCKVCEGTGKLHHTTAADVKEIAMPKRMEDLVDVSKLSAYIPFPGGVMEFLDKYADKLEDKIMRKVYNSDSILQVDFNTATEASIDLDSVYDTLHPFGDKYSEFWMFVAKLMAKYRSHDKVTVFHKFNSDYKFKPLNQLLDELKKANDSHAPSYIRESINNDISDIIYADDQSELAKLRIKNKHFPFPGKTDFEIQNIILNNLATKSKQVLYANFDSIFEEIELSVKNFYELTYEKQRGYVNEKVQEILTELVPAGPSLNFGDDDI